MPWQVEDVMEKRMRFVLSCEAPGTNMSELCREYGISRPTGYLWRGRYRDSGSLCGLKEKSRRPKGSPRKTKEEVEERVEELRRKHGWGGKKLRVLLLEEGLEVPVITINRILKRRGLVEEREEKCEAKGRYERSRTNELWQMDFKGEYRVEGGKCYPLSILDDHSRYLVGLHGLGDQKGGTVERVLVKTFEEYGLPEEMLMDHGVPWWSTTNAQGLTVLSVFLMKQGIQLRYSGVCHPQTQGKVERMHRTLKEWVRRRGKAEGLRAWGKQLEVFREEYNQVRPHEALGQRTPASEYQRSTLKYKAQPKEWEYEPGAEVRRLNTQGCLDYQHRRYFVSESLRGELVQLERTAGHLLIRYRRMYVREIALDTGRTYPLVCPVGDEE